MKVTRSPDQVTIALRSLLLLFVDLIIKLGRQLLFHFILSFHRRTSSPQLATIRFTVIQSYIAGGKKRVLALTTIPASTLQSSALQLQPSPLLCNQNSGLNHHVVAASWSFLMASYRRLLTSKVSDERWICITTT